MTTIPDNFEHIFENRKLFAGTSESEKESPEKAAGLN